MKVLIKVKQFTKENFQNLTILVINNYRIIMRKKQTPTATPATTAFEQGHKTKKEVICSILKRKNLQWH